MNAILPAILDGRSFSVSLPYYLYSCLYYLDCLLFVLSINLLSWRPFITEFFFVEPYLFLFLVVVY